MRADFNPCHILNVNICLISINNNKILFIDIYADGLAAYIYVGKKFLI